MSYTPITSNNTANTIVTRDASGNFSAGTITANLTGNATGLTAALPVTFGGRLVPISPRHVVARVIAVSATTDQDVYTVPAGKKLLIETYWAYNYSGASTIITVKHKRAGVTKAITASFNTASNNVSGAVQMPMFFVFEAGDTVVLNSSRTSVTMGVTMVEFSDATPVKTLYVDSWTAGDNTVFTATTTSVLLSVSFSLAGQQAWYLNDSGATALTYQWFVVPTGSTKGTEHAVGASTTVGASVSPASFACNAYMLANDLLIVNVGANRAAGQYLFITILEL